MTALGIRDNNPLNLVWRKQDKWLGLANPPQAEGKCSYIDPKYAFRAYTKELISYIKAGHDTVPKFIKVWSETDQDAYIINVLRWGHFRANQVLSVDDALPLFKAMCRQEDGSDPYLDSVIQEGIDMALGKSDAATASVSVHPTVVMAGAMGIADAVTQLVVGAFHDFAHVDIAAARQVAITLIVAALLHHFFPKGDQQS